MESKNAASRIRSNAHFDAVVSMKPHPALMTQAPANPAGACVLGGEAPDHLAIRSGGFCPAMRGFCGSS